MSMSNKNQTFAACPGGLQPYQQRMIDEHKVLTIKINALSNKCLDGIDAAEVERMRNQLRFMKGYADVLFDRINVFLAKA